MELLDNNKPQVKLNNIHTLILGGISINKTELVEVNGCGAIYSNDETSNAFYIFCFTNTPNTL